MFASEGEGETAQAPRFTSLHLYLLLGLFAPTGKKSPIWSALDRFVLFAINSGLIRE
jgi:hypothetical protein